MGILAIDLAQEEQAGFIDASSNVIYYPFNQEERRARIEAWLSEQRPLIVSPGEIIELRKRRLDAGEYGMIKDNLEDYWPVAFAKGMNAEQRSHFLRFNPTDDAGFAHYTRMQLAWGAVGIKFFCDEKGRMPEMGERNGIMGRLSEEFRVFHALKTRALQERVDYSWAEEMINVYHRESLCIPS